MPDHDSPSGERLAGFWHLGFAVAYCLAMLWHLKGAREHFQRL